MHLENVQNWPKSYQNRPKNVENQANWSKKFVRKIPIQDKNRGTSPKNPATGPQTYRATPAQLPTQFAHLPLICIFGPSFSHFGFSRRWGVPGCVSLQAVRECPWHHKFFRLRLAGWQSLAKLNPSLFPLFSSDAFPMDLTRSQFPSCVWVWQQYCIRQWQY